ncbi:hypothetical protein ACFTWF_16990 [Rhodococcus sp. NPDC056960]|uniref:hypothetical protein n=1 Tax=Rhodococcus sp. NPDC056960 TaxID=3345982 RepID=UPI00362AAB77
MLAVIPEWGWDHALHSDGAIVHVGLVALADRHPSLPAMLVDGRAGTALGRR